MAESEHALDLDAVQFDEKNCAICLEPVEDRCVLPRCFHSCFCFRCLVEWTETKQGVQTCPLCVTPLGPYVLHNLDPTLHKFVLYHLPDAPTHEEVRAALAIGSDDDATPPPPSPTRARRRFPDLESVQRREDAEHRRKMDRALQVRRRVYRFRWYAKHVASNRYTKYRPYPGPAGFRTNPSYARLLSVFLQRELQIWPHVDIAFLSFYIPAMLSHLDIQSEALLERLTEWIGNKDDAHHLVHEMQLFVRSGRGGLGLDQYDQSPWVQYDD